MTDPRQMTTVVNALSATDHTTLTLALTGWAARCDAEAKAMDGFAETFPDRAPQCRANASASRVFAAEARNLCNRLNRIG